MTGLNVALLIKANAAQAKGELASVTERTKLFGTQTRQAGQDARATAAAMAAYEARIAAMEAELRRLIAAQGAAGDANDKVRKSHDGAAQSVGQMTAQLNDVFVMMAAGQNPMQLAIQQGTQITQNYGKGGAAGALDLFKQGFASMIRPVNLGTIAILAGGAALVQWGLSAIGAGADTKTFQERVDDAQASIDALNTAVKVYSLDGLVALKEKYGAVNAEVLALVENQRLLAIADGTTKVREAVAAINAERRIRRDLAHFRSCSE
jgi:Prophage tail length tape measure protein